MVQQRQQGGFRPLLQTKSLQSGAQTVFVGLGMAKRSLFLVVLRKVILLIPLALLLPRLIGAAGIFVAEPVSDTISAVTAGLMYLSIRRQYLRPDDTR